MPLQGAHATIEPIVVEQTAETAERKPGKHGANAMQLDIRDAGRQSRDRENGLFVASVEKAFRVLDAISAANTELGLSEVAARTGIGKSAAQRFLYTLHTLGYLSQDAASKGYRLSPKLLALSDSYVRADVLKVKALPILEEANRRCEETINLTVLDGADVIYILRFPSKHVVSVNLAVGTRLPAFCTAPGRVLLAHMEHAKVDLVLARSNLTKRTETTETDPRRLHQILAQVRRQGYALSDQEAFVGDISIAAPIFDEQGQVAAAVNVAVPFPRWSIPKAKRLLMPIVKEVGKSVSRALGWKG
jgi:PcaR/PcaU/PobR family beta-ketoadipate pathway transcriptional regulator